MDLYNSKSFRILNMFESLNRGEVINKKELAKAFGISEKSVQRDIDDLRAYLSECYESGDVTIDYDYIKGGYRLIKQEREFLTNDEILAISKVLLESRGFCKEELNKLIDKLLLQATPSARMNIKELILKERFHYIPPRHGKMLLERIWEISEYIQNQEKITFDYTKMNGSMVHRSVEPLAIMFSEFYFYLIAWFDDHSKDFPAVFRIDRITGLKNTKEKFKIPYSERFNDGEFRKRVFFMYPGALRKIKFEFSGPSIEAILDKIPTAEIIKTEGNKYTIQAECYGDGILMWLRTQGKNLNILE
ncbi:MAG: WYL domain-containing protein [Clostridiales bacterium]|nr:WYL domain-containing protein [Clostridiales bacterium]